MIDINNISPMQSNFDLIKKLAEDGQKYGYDKLNNAGTISTEQAKEKTYAEYDKIRIIQDREYLSDFDKEIKLLMDKVLFDTD